MNKEACVQIKDQIKGVGFDGQVIDVQDVKRRTDIRIATLRLIAEEIEKRNVPGAMAEVGVYQGAFAAEMNRLLPDREIYLFDTFEGFDERDLEVESRHSNADFSDTCPEAVKTRLPFPERAHVVKGYFPDSAPDQMPKLALVSLDPDLYQPTYEGLKYFYPLMSNGGMILIHDYNSTQFPGVSEAVDKFCAENELFVVPVCDLHGSAVLVKAVMA